MPPKVRVDLSRLTACTACNGRGISPGTIVTCVVCDGEGLLYFYDESLSNVPTSSKTHRPFMKWEPVGN